MAEATTNMVTKSLGYRINEKTFTADYFREFLIDTIFTEVESCDVHIDGKRRYLTAIGKLMNQYYLVQITSDDVIFENLRVVQLAPTIISMMKRNL